MQQQREQLSPTVHTGIPVDTDTHAPDEAGRTAPERYELRPVR